MYSPTTINDFLHLVRESGLIDERLLNLHLEGIRNGDTLILEPRDLAENLLRARLLTPYQAEQLLLGNWRGFSIAKYTILDRLGSGSTGSVYLCEQPAMRRKVAVKVLPFITDAAPSTVQRFRREARALATLDHPNVVHVHDFDQEGEQLFLVMEYIDGISLQDLVKRTGPLDALHGAHYMRQAAKGLQHIHEAGLVHRDIKPGNLMLDAKGTVKILDLGLARPLYEEHEALTAKYDAKRVLGTADFLAPEQAVDSHDVDIRADIYGLGATFYFLLTGCTPFSNGTVVQKLLWVQTREPTALRELSPDVPEGLAQVVAKMMAKDPGQRYQTPAEVVGALDSWVQTPVAPPAPELLTKARSRSAPRVPAELAETPAPRKTAPLGRRGVASPVESKGMPEVPARLLYPRPSDARKIQPPAGSAIDQPPPARTLPTGEAPRVPKLPPGEEGYGWVQVIIVVATIALSIGLGIAATLASSWRLF